MCHFKIVTFCSCFTRFFIGNKFLHNQKQSLEQFFDSRGGLSFAKRVYTGNLKIIQVTCHDRFLENKSESER